MQSLLDKRLVTLQAYEDIIIDVFIYVPTVALVWDLFIPCLFIQ